MSQANITSRSRRLERTKDSRSRYEFPVNFVSYQFVAEFFKGKTVAIVGSGPSVLDNPTGFIDAHDIVVRVNNYKTDKHTGFRCDVYYSFFGISCRKTAKELKEDGVKLCMCKLPNKNFVTSQWHVSNGKQSGIDFKSIYHRRHDWWFCDTYIPHKERMESYMECIKGRMPTTGFTAILDILSFDCEVYLTGFDFFKSKIHNVDEKWRPGYKRDPIGHKPELELHWLKQHRKDFRITFDEHLNVLV